MVNKWVTSIYEDLFCEDVLYMKDTLLVSICDGQIEWILSMGIESRNTGMVLQ